MPGQLEVLGAAGSRDASAVENGKLKRQMSHAAHAAVDKDVILLLYCALVTQGSERCRAGHGQAGAVPEGDSFRLGNGSCGLHDCLLAEGIAAPVGQPAEDLLAGGKATYTAACSCDDSRKVTAYSFRKLASRDELKIAPANSLFDGINRGRFDSNQKIAIFRRGRRSIDDVHDLGAAACVAQCSHREPQ